MMPDTPAKQGKVPQTNFFSDCWTCSPQKMVLTSFRDQLTNSCLDYKKASPLQFIHECPRIQDQNLFHIQEHRSCLPLC